MSANLQSIDSYCGHQNTGGLIEIQYAPENWISIFPDGPNDNYEITTAPTFIPGKDWLTAKVLSETLRFREPQQDSKQGDYYNQQLSGIIPRWTAELSGLFNRMKNFRYIIRVKDKEGIERILGNKQYPFRFSTSLDTGASTDKLKAHSIEFRAQNPNKASGYNI